VRPALYSSTEIILLLFPVIVPIFVIKVIKKIRLHFSQSPRDSLPPVIMFRHLNNTPFVHYIGRKSLKKRGLGNEGDKF
jgi:hypothetical protein